MSEIPTRQELETQLTERAWQDDAFRADLLADPAAVIRRELHAHGLTLPDGVTITVHEETPAQVHLVLPASPATAEDTELDDEALDLVAGGGSGEGIPQTGFCT